MQPVDHEIIKIKTPCIGVCSTALGGRVCRGCKRFAHEVIDWNAYSFQQKSLVEQRLSDFLTTVMKNVINIFDEKLMAWQIAKQRVQVPTHRNIYCQAFVLLKAGASQVQDYKKFGFEVVPSARHMPLKALCQQIDEEFYALSVAHFEHCFINFS